MNPEPGTRARCTYVYCLILAARRPSLAGIPAGLPGTGPVRLLEIDQPDADAGTRRRGPATRPLVTMKRWIAVADAPLSRYGEEPINRRLSDLNWVSRAAIAHEAVIESFIAAPAVLPMKLFTIFENDSRVLEHLRVERRRIDRVLRRVVNHEEWGVRLVLQTGNRTSKDVRPRKGEPIRSGALYLSMKKSRRDQAARLAQGVQRTTAELYDRLDADATRSTRRGVSELPANAAPLLLDAAFLVQRSRSARFRARLAREARRLEPEGYLLTLSGPWPPYSFIQD
jgi:hypothetical protein